MSYEQIDHDLSNFPDIDMDLVAPEAVSRFSDRGRHSLCHYKIVDNKVCHACTNKQTHTHTPAHVPTHMHTLLTKLHPFCICIGRVSQY